MENIKQVRIEYTLVDEKGQERTVEGRTGVVKQGTDVSWKLYGEAQAVEQATKDITARLWEVRG